MGAPGVASDQTDPKGRAFVGRPVQWSVRSGSLVFDELDTDRGPGLAVARELEDLVSVDPGHIACGATADGIDSRNGAVEVDADYGRRLGRSATCRDHQTDGCHHPSRRQAHGLPTASPELFLHR